jgi:hypothetical protein
LSRFITSLAIALHLTAMTPLSANPLPAPPKPELEKVLSPRDDAALDYSFRAFREGLLKTIEGKNSQELLAVVAPDIRINFDDTNGREAFTAYWKPEETTSKVWPALQALLFLGGKLTTSTQFVAPYIYAIWPEDRDVFEYVAVVAPAAMLREEPQAGSVAGGAPLNYAIVEIIDSAGLKAQHECTDTDWLRVKTVIGAEGFVMCREVRSPVDYRAFFEKRGDKWMMTAFIATPLRP